MIALITVASTSLHPWSGTVARTGCRSISLRAQSWCWGFDVPFSIRFRKNAKRGGCFFQVQLDWQEVRRLPMVVCVYKADVA